MQLLPIDWIIVVVSIAASFLPAVLLAKRGGSSTAEFFTSGRAAPWWLIGVSMVATTFSTDTPNLVTNLVREKGVANNWQWWAFLLTGMATVFFYAKLWRRSGVLTDLEFYEQRYSGKPATLVRGFRAVYLGLFFNCVIMATVNLAAAKIANVMLGWPMGKTLLICGVLNVAFAATSGLWGVLVTDFIQFGIAMTGQLRGRVLRPPAAGSGRARRADRADRPAGPEPRPRFRRLGTHPLGADHSDHDSVVVGLVSRGRTGWRELHRPADARREEREGRGERHPVLQCRPLRPALVAVDHRGTVLVARLSAALGHRAHVPLRGSRSSSATTWRIRRCSGFCRTGCWA